MHQDIVSFLEIRAKSEERPQYVNMSSATELGMRLRHWI